MESPAEYTEYFYNNFVGKYPFEDDRFKTMTTRAISHLLESLNGRNNILIEVFEASTDKMYIDIEDLPDIVWKNSLIKKNTFYYHKDIQIRSKAPCFDYAKGINIVYPYFLELKEQYNEEDVLEYMKTKIEMTECLIDKNKIIGGIKYMLKKYSNIDIATPLDYILFLIDSTSSKKYISNNILNDLQEFENVAYEKLKTIINISKAKGFNKVVWRN